jgi:hypothetical protein
MYLEKLEVRNVFEILTKVIENLVRHLQGELVDYDPLEISQKY